MTVGKLLGFETDRSRWIPKLVKDKGPTIANLGMDFCHTRLYCARALLCLSQIDDTAREICVLRTAKAHNIRR